LSPDDEDEKPKAHDFTHTIVGAKRQSRPTGLFPTLDYTIPHFQFCSVAEKEHETKIMKVRHYDSSDVRRYMNSKRAERKKQELEAHQAK
jgi:hypothetical protein